MSIRDMLRAWLCDKQPEPVEPVERPFYVLYTRTGKHVYIVLHDAFPNAHIRVADAEYSTMSLDEFNKWIKTDDVSTNSYRSEWRDCDDYAHEIKCRILRIGQEYKTTITVAYCEGSSPGGYHAFNILIDNTDKIWVLEPQTDMLTLWDDSTYTPDFIQV